MIFKNKKLMETLKNLFPYVQSVIAILLMLFILLQSSSAGLSSSFGGTDMPESTRRGPEKFLYYGTIVLGLILVLHSIMFIIIS